MTQFINRPDKLAAIKAELANAKADSMTRQAEILNLKRQVDALTQILTEVTAVDTDCDLCALEIDYNWARDRVGRENRLLRQDLCGSLYPPKFKAAGQSNILNLLIEIQTCNVALAEHATVLAQHAWSECAVMGKEQRRAELIDELMTIMAGEDIDPRCQEIIDRVTGG